MRGVWLLGGVLIGFGCGWLVFDREPARPVERPAVPDALDQPPALEAPLDAMRPADPEPDREPAPKPLSAAARRAIEEGSQAAAVAHVQQHGYLDEAVEALIARARRLYDEGDKNAFLQTLELLGEADHETAHAYFVELLPLAPPDWPEDFKHQGRRFQSALARATTPGIAAAARRRIEAYGVKPGRPLRNEWRQLVVQHGSAADRAWLVALDGTEYYVLVDEAGLSDRDRARRGLDDAIRAWREGRLGERPDPVFRVLQRFAWAHPDAGAPLIAEALHDGELGGAPVNWGRARLLALAVLGNDEDVAARAEQLLAIPDDARRYGAYMALFQRSGFVRAAGPVERALEDVTRTLERAAEVEGILRLEDDQVVAAALGSISQWHAIAPGRLLDALERVTSRLEDADAKYWKRYLAEQRKRAGARWK